MKIENKEQLESLLKTSSVSYPLNDQWIRTFSVGDNNEILESDNQKNSTFHVPSVEVSLEYVLKQIENIEVEII